MFTKISFDKTESNLLKVNSEQTIKRNDAAVTIYKN